MSNVLDQWLGDSISAIEMLERELNDHQEVIQHAMATIRRHTAAVERLEVHIEVIRGAAQHIEGAVEEDRFDESFQESYSDSYEELSYEDSDAGAAPTKIDEGAGTPVLQLRPESGPVSTSAPASQAVAAGAGARARLPPPPPSAATRR